MKKELILAFSIILVGVTAGCASMTPISQVNQANLILTQVSATLDSAAVLFTELSKNGQSPQVLHDVEIALKVLKPQIVAWIDTISQLKASAAQYTAAQDMKVKLEALTVKIDATVK